LTHQALTLIVLDLSKRQQGHDNAGGALSILLLPASSQSKAKQVMRQLVCDVRIKCHKSQARVKNGAEGCGQQVQEDVLCLMCILLCSHLPGRCQLLA
jgi:hypothetical protein